MITGIIIAFVIILLSNLLIITFDDKSFALNSSFNYSFKGLVAGVVDGYTLEIGNSTVKLSLIDDKVLGEETIGEATHYTSMLCPIRSPALIYPDNHQQDGKEHNNSTELSAVVYCLANIDGNNSRIVSINESLLEAKLAVIDKKACKVSDYAKEEWALRYGCNKFHR